VPQSYSSFYFYPKKNWLDSQSLSEKFYKLTSKIKENKIYLMRKIFPYLGPVIKQNCCWVSTEIRSAAIIYRR
jgi:hypothetical protein